MNRVIKTYYLDPLPPFALDMNIDTYINNLKDPIKSLVLSKPGVLKCYIQIKLKLRYWNNEDEEDDITPTFYNEVYCRPEYLLYDESGLDRIISVILDNIRIKIDKFESSGSGWILLGPVKCSIRLIRYIDDE
jgi:hypothetical protein